MKGLVQFIRESNEGKSNSVKFNSVKAAVKQLLDSVKEIEDDDAKAVAVYNALGDPYRGSGYGLFSGDGSKIIVKEYDRHYYRSPSDNQIEKARKKYEEIFNDIMYNGEIENLYNRGKKIIEDQKKEEARRRAEAAALAKTAEYKEFCDKCPGVHLIYKLLTFYKAWTDHHLWTVLKKNAYGAIKNMMKEGYIKSSDAKEGEYYIMVDEHGPNMESKKGYKSDSRYNIINWCSILKYLGDEKWEVILPRTYYGYGEPKAVGKETYFDQDFYVIPFKEFIKKNETELKELIDMYAKYIQEDIDDNKKEEERGGKGLYPYDSNVMSLLTKDTL